mmetsp:Transcript_69666/g.193900  ORF Transcript_69666/g.193900 Transcript_69666/m.193900 type:complete len:217 (+) Transcript_69666:1954-2604(+)
MRDCHVLVARCRAPARQTTPWHLHVFSEELTTPANGKRHLQLFDGFAWPLLLQEHDREVVPACCHQRFIPLYVQQALVAFKLLFPFLLEKRKVLKAEWLRHWRGLDHDDAWGQRGCHGRGRGHTVAHFAQAPHQDSLTRANGLDALSVDCHPLCKCLRAVVRVFKPEPFAHDVAADWNGKQTREDAILRLAEHLSACIHAVHQVPVHRLRIVETSV